MPDTFDLLTDRTDRYCQVCQARPGKPCRNTIRPGEPLPGRAVHIARATNLQASDKEGRNDACY